ncbi:MAG: hypothetical protein JO344_12470 [Planctomycetaceae bacterium]|nr:hypothetical protein [Planctomycetaceae bacterium]
MFFRTKTSGTRSYLQIVENRWEDGRPRQRVIATLRRLDQLQQTGQFDSLLVSGRYALTPCCSWTCYFVLSKMSQNYHPRCERVGWPEARRRGPGSTAQAPGLDDEPPAPHRAFHPGIRASANFEQVW